MFANGTADHLITDQLIYANDVKLISTYLKKLINECGFNDRGSIIGVIQMLKSELRSK